MEDYGTTTTAATTTQPVARKKRTPKMAKATPALLDNRLFLRVKEYAQLTGTPEPTVYALVHSGRLEHTRIGSSIRIPVTALKQLVVA